MKSIHTELKNVGSKEPSIMPKISDNALDKDMFEHSKSIMQITNNKSNL